MASILISESNLSNISRATRKAYADSRLRSLEDDYYDLTNLDNQNQWSWAVNDGKTYLHFNVYDSDYLTVSIFASIKGTLYWGDHSEIETCNDTNVTIHTHTYTLTGQYAVQLHGIIILGGSSSVMSQANVIVQTYLEKIEVGADTTFGSAGINLPKAQYIYFSNKSNYHEQYNWQNSNFRFMYLNKVAIRCPANGFSQYWGCDIQAFYGDGSIIIEGIHAFRETIVKTMDHVSVTLGTVSSYNRYLMSKGLCKVLHFTSPMFAAQGAPNNFLGSFYYVNFPSNLTAFNDTNSYITILSTGELHCQNPTPPTLRAGSITCQTGAKIYVPVGCLEAYQAASNWSALADYMEEEYE